MKEKNDEKLIIQYLRGDEKSLEILIKRYLRPIYSFVYQRIGNSQEAEDIAQEVFIKVWRNLKKFKHEYKFKTWVFAIAKNASIDFLKKKKTTSLLEEKLFVAAQPLSNKLLLDSMLNKLSPKYRLILSYYYNDGFTLREIAETLGESINTIKSRHLRALAQLKKLLSKN